MHASGYAKRTWERKINKSFCTVRWHKKGDYREGKQVDRVAETWFSWSNVALVRNMLHTRQISRTIFSFAFMKIKNKVMQLIEGENNFLLWLLLLYEIKIMFSIVSLRNYSWGPPPCPTLIFKRFFVDYWPFTIRPTSTCYSANASNNLATSVVRA